MPNDFYTPSGAPSTGSSGSSSPIRSEFAAISTGFDKLPVLAGNANKVVKVNGSGTGLEAGSAVALTGGSIDDSTVNLDGGSLVLPQGTATAPVTEGQVYWNTSTDALTVGTGAAAKTIADTNSTQTLTNKAMGAGCTWTGNVINALYLPTLNQNTTGNAATATALQNSRTINGVSFDGTANITVTASTTNSLTFSNGGSGGASGTTYNGASAQTISYNSIGAPSTTGANATGTWGISISGASASCTGNAATVTNGVYTTGPQTIGGAKTFSDSITIQNGAPIINLFESDQTLPAGRRRLVQDGNTFSVRRNTAVGGDFSTEAYDVTVSSTGDFTALGNVTAYSDERLKADWVSLQGDLLERLASVKAGTYTRTDTGERQVGVSAQSLREVLPEAVLEDAQGMLSVAYGNAALAACVTLAQEVVALRARVAALEAR